MRIRALSISLALAAVAATGYGQVLSNASLTGKYFVRHVEFTTDSNNNATDSRSIYGTITFDGAGNYTVAGTQLIGNGPATAFSVNGTYTLTPSGAMKLTNPQDTPLTLNARFGTEAVMGSSTDASGQIFDTFLAIPAPASNVSPAFSNATLSGNYHMADFELTGAQTQQVRVSGATATFDGGGNIATFRPIGHSAANGGGSLASQEFNGLYTVASDGTGTMGFSVVGSVGAGPALLQPSNRTLYVSATRNVFFAVFPGSHDVLIGILNATTPTNVSFAGRYWLNGLGIDSGKGSSQDFIASTSVLGSATTVLLTSRNHQVPSVAPQVPALVNQTETQSYAYLMAGLGMQCGCGIGSQQNVVVLGNAFLMEGNGGTLLGVTPSVDINGTANADTASYLIMFGQQIPTLTGPGVWINPQGIVNSATYAPVGDFISPGEFISIYGSGFVASGSTTATTLPFQPSLGGVSVSINGTNAPMYYVSPGLIICIVPYELVTTGPATVVVTSGQTPSNSVVVGTSAVSPGVFSANDFGFGDGAITHADAHNTLVNAANPAAPGETVQMYLVGLGALQTPVADGNGGVGIDDAVIKPLISIADQPANVSYWGLTVDAGLYQINFTVPQGTPDGEQNIIVFIPNGAIGSLTQTITIAVQSPVQTGS
jgi:uncharacterized protein (TIGR03437 family)